MPRKKSKLPVTGGMQVNSYAVLVRAIEEGVAYGWNRAHKHTNKPGEEKIREEIENGVTNAISEYFDFDRGVE